MKLRIDVTEQLSCQECNIVSQIIEVSEPVETIIKKMMSGHQILSFGPFEMLTQNIKIGFQITTGKSLVAAKSNRGNSK